MNRAIQSIHYGNELYNGRISGFRFMNEFLIKPVTYWSAKKLGAKEGEIVVADDIFEGIYSLGSGSLMNALNNFSKAKQDYDYYSKKTIVQPSIQVIRDVGSPDQILQKPETKKVKQAIQTLEMDRKIQKKNKQHIIGKISKFSEADQQIIKSGQSSNPEHQKLYKEYITWQNDIKAQANQERTEEDYQNNLKQRIQQEIQQQ